MRIEEEVGTLHHQPRARRVPVRLQELAPVGAVHGARPAARWDEGVGDDAVVHRVARRGALGGVGEREHATRPEECRIELRCGEGGVGEAQQLAHRNAVRVLGAAEAVGDADDAHVAPILSIEDA